MRNKKKQFKNQLHFLDESQISVYNTRKKNQIELMMMTTTTTTLTSASVSAAKRITNAGKTGFLHGIHRKPFGVHFYTRLA